MRYPVSIHAAREGGDPRWASLRCCRRGFNPRRPRGRRPCPPGIAATRFWFQSTPPARAATDSAFFICVRHSGFNPRRPRGRRLRTWQSKAGRYCFNPRRPRGRRRISQVPSNRAFGFQSTPPARAATWVEPSLALSILVSIHAAREGGDNHDGQKVPFQHGFNPRRPRGRRRSTAAARTSSICFNPRRPRGRRLPIVTSPLPVLRFNPRRPRGRRPAQHLKYSRFYCFNPRRPRGRRRAKLYLTERNAMFQSTPPARAATWLREMMVM